MNLYGLFILDVNIKYIVFSILYRHINVPMACKELKMYWAALGHSAPVLILSPHMYSVERWTLWGGSAVMPMTALCRDYLTRGLSVCMYVCIYVLYVCIYTQTYIHAYIHTHTGLFN